MEQYKERCQTLSATKDPDIEEANNDDDKELCPLNYSDALDLLGLLHWFASQKDGDLLPGINKLTDHVEQKILEKQRQNKQTCITDFFVKPVPQCSHTHSPYCLILQPNLPVS